MKTFLDQSPQAKVDSKETTSLLAFRRSTFNEAIDDERPERALRSARIRAGNIRAWIATSWCAEVSICTRLAKYHLFQHSYLCMNDKGIS